MNRSLIFSLFSLGAIFAPDAVFGADRLDAPGPGYRHQVGRFAPQGMKARPFELQIAQPFGPAASQGMATFSSTRGFIRASELLFSPAALDTSDFSQPIRLFDPLRASDSGLLPVNPLPNTPKKSP